MSALPAVTRQKRLQAEQKVREPGTRPGFDSGPREAPPPLPPPLPAGPAPLTQRPEMLLRGQSLGPRPQGQPIQVGFSNYLYFTIFFSSYVQVQWGGRPHPRARQYDSEIKAVPPHINPIDYTQPAAQPLPRSRIKTL